MAAGVAASSLALVGFGLDSFIEVFAGGVVLWQLRCVAEERERRALRLIGLSFFVLAGYVVVEGVRNLVVGDEAGESTIGIVIAGLSLAVMPPLAWAKRRTGRELANPVILADETETALAPIYPRFSSGGCYSTPPLDGGGPTLWPPSVSRPWLRARDEGVAG